MQKITTRLLKKMILVCLFVSPITNIYADTSQLLQERQRAINEQRKTQQKINEYQAEYNAKLEYERRNREYQQKLDTARKPEVPTQQQINQLADLMDSNATKKAVNYMDNLQPDPYQPRQVEHAEMDGFYMGK